MGVTGLLGLLTVAALPVGLTAVLMIHLAGRRLPPIAVKLLAAVAFMIGPAYVLWRLEWFDVWRHGVPSPSYLVTTFVPYLGVFAVLGWLTAHRLSRGDR